MTDISDLFQCPLKHTFKRFVLSAAFILISSTTTLAVTELHYDCVDTRVHKFSPPNSNYSLFDAIELDAGTTRKFQITITSQEGGTNQTRVELLLETGTVVLEEVCSTFDEPIFQALSDVVAEETNQPCLAHWESAGQTGVYHSISFFPFDWQGADQIEFQSRSELNDEGSFWHFGICTLEVK